MNMPSQQYQQIKWKYPDAILLFRIGEFYEVFDEDAKTVAFVTGITINENKNGEEPKFSASLPFHSLDSTIHKLVSKGCKVAICEELEDPETAKGAVKRGVTDFL